MSFGLEHVAPALADFFAAYPEISIDLQLGDQAVDQAQTSIQSAPSNSTPGAAGVKRISPLASRSRNCAAAGGACKTATAAPLAKSARSSAFRSAFEREVTTAGRLPYRNR